MCGMYVAASVSRFRIILKSHFHLVPFFLGSWCSGCVGRLVGCSVTSPCLLTRQEEKVGGVWFLFLLALVGFYGVNGIIECGGEGPDNTHPVVCVIVYLI